MSALFIVSNWFCWLCRLLLLPVILDSAAPDRSSIPAGPHHHVHADCVRNDWPRVDGGQILLVRFLAMLMAKPPASCSVIESAWLGALSSIAMQRIITTEAVARRFLFFEYLSLSVFTYYGIFSIAITPNMPVRSVSELRNVGLARGLHSCVSWCTYALWFHMDAFNHIASLHSDPTV